MPCSYALAALKVPGKRWRTRAERLAVLERARERIVGLERDDLAGLAQEVGLSPYHLQRLFAAAFGESPREMAERVRAERAAELLRSGATPLEVVVSLRYSEASALSREFRRRHGVSPSAFRKNCQRGGPAAGED